MSAGNLSTHLRKLEDAGYVQITKTQAGVGVPSGKVQRVGLLVNSIRQLSVVTIVSARSSRLVSGP